MQLLSGALLERPPGPKYTAELGFAEFAPQNPLPKPSTLTKWRKALPEGFEVALRAPEAAWNSLEGPLRAGAALDAGLQWLGGAVAALEPSLLVIPTGATITTGARDRQRLRDYFSRLPRPDGLTIVWRPTGLWEPDAVQSMAKTLSAVGGFDAVDDPVPDAPLVYGALLAEGLRRSFSHAQLLDVADKLQRSGAERAYVTVDSPQSFREARLLRAIDEGRA
jgi:uncharacterized protein YecE (DUF72 family)